MGATEAALATLESVETTPTSLINYQSNGHVIVFGNETVLKLCDDFAEPLKVTGVSMGASRQNPASGAIALNQRDINIQGHLGKFTVSLVDAHDMVETLQADIILDLNPQPLITLEIPPGVPAWAVYGREVMRSLLRYSHWWHDNRLMPDGQLGGNWNDDPCLTGYFTLQAALGDEKALRVIQKVADGWVENSGHNQNHKQVPHPGHKR